MTDGTNVRPHLRDCPFCKAKGDNPEMIMFTCEQDAVDDFPYSYSIRCFGCGVSINDEYREEVVRLWNGEDKVEDEE